MSKILIQAAIGPVQDYIASARKLRDLWFGSYLLSELSKTVARSFKDQGAELIIPFAESDKDFEKDSDLIVANKIFAELKNGLDPDKIIEQAKKDWLNHKNEFAEKTLEILSKEFSHIQIRKDLFKKQINDSGEFYAAWTKYDDEKDYKIAKHKLEKLLAGRKNLRIFYRPEWNGEGIPKNSLDGLRESVTMENQKEIKGIIKANEKLDTLGLVKRFYSVSKYNKNFDDLSKIAIKPWLKQFDLMDFTYLNNFLSNFSEINIEKSAGNGKNFVLNHAEYFFTDKSELLKNKNAYKDYAKFKAMFGDPNKYACIFVGDGDNMGKALDQIETLDGHRKFTKNLGEFAKSVGKIIESYGGSLIYAGGDDVMAYLTIDNFYDCADEIRKDFSRKMKKIFDELNLKGDYPTFSAGAAIVHHSMPLDQALNLAREGEGIAKKYVEKLSGSTKLSKNAFTIIQKKRSGSKIVVCDKWEKNNEKGIIPSLKNIVSFFKSQKLPNTLGYQLRNAAKESGDEIIFDLSENKEMLVPLNASSVSVLRIFNQKKHSNDFKNLLLVNNSIRKLSDLLVIGHQITSSNGKGLKNEV
ncbi:MAG: type III-B CRISPR-associated protein Cas10/Cmr2 [Desulforegulaceae bacterium]|jgi:CRISPR-associated protein Cmr2|nr:type III-B CRISPR-associated protein Cas10/Cmr2 [Desulforegulaceae bacterium]